MSDGNEKWRHTAHYCVKLIIIIITIIIIIIERLRK